MYLVKVYSQYELTYINYVPILVNKKNKEICKSQSIEHKTQIFYGTLWFFVKDGVWESPAAGLAVCWSFDRSGYSGAEF